jgi:hypothetical protein
MGEQPKESTSARSEHRWVVAGWIFGVVLPLACFALDGEVRILFTLGAPTDNDGPMPLLGAAWRLPVTASVGLGLFALGIWLWQRGRSRSVAWVLSPLLIYGFGVAFAVGVALLPYTLIGCFAGIGLLGFIPFGTAIVFFYWWYRALQETRHPWPAGAVSLIVAGGLAIGAMAVQRSPQAAPRMRPFIVNTVGPGSLEPGGDRVIVVQPQGRRAFGTHGMELPMLPVPDGAVGVAAKEWGNELRVFSDGTARLSRSGTEEWRVQLAMETPEGRVFAAAAGPGWVVVAGDDAFLIANGRIEERVRWSDVRSVTSTRWGLLVRTETELKMCDGLRERWSCPARGAVAALECGSQVVVVSDLIECRDGRSGAVESTAMIPRVPGRLRRASIAEFRGRLFLVYDAGPMTLYEATLDGRMTTLIDHAEDIVVIDETIVSMTGGVLSFFRRRRRD